MAETSLLASLLNPDLVRERERLARQQAAGDGLMGQVQRVADIGSRSASGLFGIDRRSPMERMSMDVSQAVQNAEGKSLAEKLKNASAVLSKTNPTAAMLLQQKAQELGPQMTYKDIRMGTREVTEPPKFPGMPTTTKIVSNIRTGVFQNGNLIGYLGDDGQVIRLNSEEAKQIQQTQDAKDKSTGVMKGDKEPPRPAGQKKDTVIDMGDGARLVRKEDLEQPAEETKASETQAPATTTKPSTLGQMGRRGSPTAQASNGMSVGDIRKRIATLNKQLSSKSTKTKAKENIRKQIARLETLIPDNAVAPRAPVQGQPDPAQMRESRAYPNVPTEPGKLGFELPPANGQRRVIGQAVPNPDGTVSIQIGQGQMLPVTPQQLANNGLGVENGQVVVVNEDLFRRNISRQAR